MASGKFNNALLSSDEEEEILAGFSSLGSGLWTSGRKNVLHKLLHIPYRRLKAGFSVCWLCLFVKYTRCERLLLVEVCKAFLFVFSVVVLVVFSSLENYFGFRTTNVKGRTDHSVSLRWNKRFEHFQRGEYFSDDCAFELWVDFASRASPPIAGLN